MGRDAVRSEPGTFPVGLTQIPALAGCLAGGRSLLTVAALGPRAWRAALGSGTTCLCRLSSCGLGFWLQFLHVRGLPLCSRPGGLFGGQPEGVGRAAPPAQRGRKTGNDMTLLPLSSGSSRVVSAPVAEPPLQVVSVTTAHLPFTVVTHVGRVFDAGRLGSILARTPMPRHVLGPPMGHLAVRTGFRGQAGCGP